MHGDGFTKLNIAWAHDSFALEYTSAEFISSEEGN